MRVFPTKGIQGKRWEFPPSIRKFDRPTPTRKTTLPPVDYSPTKFSFLSTKGSFHAITQNKVLS